jgi:hypothetical protein
MHSTAYYALIIIVMVSLTSYTQLISVRSLILNLVVLLAVPLWGMALRENFQSRTYYRIRAAIRAESDECLLTSRTEPRVTRLELPKLDSASPVVLRGPQIFQRGHCDNSCATSRIYDAVSYYGFGGELATLRWISPYTPRRRERPCI